MTTATALARLGAIAAVVGAVVLAVATTMHPMSADPNVPVAAFTEYAADRHWVWSHAGQFVGVFVLALSMVAFADTLDDGWSRAFGRLGKASAIGLIGVAAALQAVDGVAVKRLVDQWAAAPVDQKAMAFEAAFAVRQIEIGLAGYLSLLTGLAIILFGLAIACGTHYPRWFGWLGIVDGMAFAASGWSQAATGFSDQSMILSMTASYGLLIWMIVLALLLWRYARQIDARQQARTT